MFWIGALLPDAMCGRPGLAAFPQAQLSPSPTAAQDPPAAELGQVCPKKVHRTQTGPTGIWRNGRPSGGKWWSAKSRNQNYTKGKQEESMKQKRQVKVLHLTPRVAYLRSLKNSLDREFCHLEPSAHCLPGVHVEAYSHQGTPNRAEPVGPGPPLAGSTDVGAQVCPPRGEGP